MNDLFQNVYIGLPTENLKKAVEDKSNLVIAYDGSKFQVDFGAHSFEWQVNKEILEHREDTDVTVSPHTGSHILKYSLFYIV